MKVAVTGAGGFVGAEFARRLSAGCRVLALRRGDLDITDAEAVASLFRAERPGLIINCAVVGVDASEADPSRASAVNVVGAENLARAARALGAALVQLSTNHVFDGAREGGAPYTAADAAAPVNVYGRTKLEGERAARGAWPRSFVVRTSWVFGEGKENFCSTAHRRLAAGERLRAASDVRASATYVADLVGRVWEIVGRGRPDTYHVVNEGVCSYYEFALEAARMLGAARSDARGLVEEVGEAALRRSAPRPRYTPLRCLASRQLGLAPLRDWRRALAAYIRDSRAREESREAR